MKIKNDFVTNSSSSSYIIMTKDSLTTRQLKDELSKAIDLTSNFILNLGEDIAEILTRNSEVIDIHKFIDDYTSVENITELKDSNILAQAVYKNYTEYPYIMVGFVVSDSDDPLETFLTDANIDFKNDKIVVVKYGGY